MLLPFDYRRRGEGRIVIIIIVKLELERRQKTKAAGGFSFSAREEKRKCHSDHFAPRKDSAQPSELPLSELNKEID